MAKDSSKDVAVYVVWSSQVGRERHVGKASRVIPDPRARDYWDGDKVVGAAYQPILGTPDEAWDVWMLFDKDARWEGESPPRPAWWEHQLHGMPLDLALDSIRFGKKAASLRR